ncbi:MAG: hypothetical protein NZ455_00550 [Bacteroidia bacterium]|nr:hypothetical protein [Bacteroidia bacterium]MDW8347572.1 hypothetical protein [Bacteroidia bacterium]
MLATSLLVLIMACGDIKKPDVSKQEGETLIKELMTLRLNQDFNTIVNGRNKTPCLSKKFLQRYTPIENPYDKSRGTQLNEAVLREKLFFLNDPKMVDYEVNEGTNTDKSLGARFGRVYTVKIKLKYEDGRDGGYLVERIVVGKDENKMPVIEEIELVERQVK